MLINHVGFSPHYRLSFNEWHSPRLKPDTPLHACKANAGLGVFGSHTQENAAAEAGHHG